MGKEKNTNIDVLGQQLTDHIKVADDKFKEIGGKMDSVNKSVTDIKDNHLSHLGKNVTEIKVNMAKNTTDTDWLKRFFFIIAGASIGSLIAAILNLVFNMPK